MNQRGQVNIFMDKRHKKFYKKKESEEVSSFYMHISNEGENADGVVLARRRVYRELRPKHLKCLYIPLLTP